MSDKNIFSQRLSRKVKEVGMLSFKMIKLSDGTIIGYLEETENIIDTSYAKESKQTQKLYYVYDIDFNKTGFITEHGTVSVYKYTSQGSVIQIAHGEVYTLEASVKKLLSYPLTKAIYWEDFEPAPPWSQRH
jgi:hypothetical protein